MELRGATRKKALRLFFSSVDEYTDIEVNVTQL